jgi:hypothetical protein
MADDDWFSGWVKLHVQATGADAVTVRVLLANRLLILDPPWSATQAELGECTARLVRECRTPKFPNEHTDAVGKELARLREERRQALLGPPLAAPGDFAPDCPACGGSGLATIPVRACVWDGRLVLHPTLRRVLTGAVLCDRPGCAAGERAQAAEGLRKLDDRLPRRPRLSQCERAVGGIDLPELLREEERRRAEEARRQGFGGPLGANLAEVLAARGIRRAAA